MGWVETVGQESSGVLEIFQGMGRGPCYSLIAAARFTNLRSILALALGQNVRFQRGNTLNLRLHRNLTKLEMVPNSVLTGLIFLGI